MKIYLNKSNIFSIIYNYKLNFITSLSPFNHSLKNYKLNLFGQYNYKYSVQYSLTSFLLLIVFYKSSLEIKT